MADEENGSQSPLLSRPDTVFRHGDSGQLLLKPFDANSTSETMFPAFLMDTNADTSPNTTKCFTKPLVGFPVEESAEIPVLGGSAIPDGLINRKNAGSGRSFGERFAARTGGSSPRLNTARYKSMPPSSLPIPRSPCLTIPPGLSPTTLLDSPVLLSTVQAEPSPTTGTFSSPQILCESAAVSDPLISSDVSKYKSCEDGNSSSFVFKPYVKSGPGSCLSPLRGLPGFGSSYPQSQSQSEFQAQTWAASASTTKKEFPLDSLPEREVSSTPVEGPTSTLPLQAIPPIVPPAQSALLEEQQQGQSSNIQVQPSEIDQNAQAPLTVIERASEDGYNWRKYGQKQVKGSEYPRSYYKCTHPNCQMKKKLERSHDGQITEIIYKGVHDHPKPQPSRRLAVGAAHVSNEGGERGEGFNSTIRVEDSSSTMRQISSHVESTGTPEQSSISASDDDEEGGGMQGGKSLGEDADEDESDSKRRRKENNSLDIIAAGRTVREPRVVVQTTSEIDILDDGYRWRKYGQKVVKGNPNPRSYYKCTNAGCPVRKHVERASHDPKAVITTYEGKHNHDVPAARNSSHDNAGTGNAVSAAAMPNNFTVPTNTMRSGSQIQDTAPHFEKHLGIGNDYGKHAYMFERVGNGSLNSQDRSAVSLDLGVGVVGMGFDVLGVDNRHGQKWQTVEMPTSFSTQMRGPTSLGMVGAGLNGGRPVGPIQSFFGQAKERDIDFQRPKEEQLENFSFETSLPLNRSSNSSIYHQNMGRLLMGP